MIGDNYIRHIGDIPAGWNITSLAEWTCVKHCKYKGSAFQVDFSWSHNYQCDCRDVPFYHSFFIDHSVFWFLPCRDPLPLRRKYVIQIPLEEFACDWPDGCPSGCRCAYRPANATFHVYCSAVNLPSLPLHVPPLPKSYDRCKLDFSKNKVLRRLEYRPYFVSTFLLDVSNCAIDVVDLNAWREFARLQSPFLTYAQVYLHGNDIVSVPLEVTGINFSSVQIALNQNPWECSCGNKWMIGWLKSLSFVFLNGADIMCASPARLAGKSIIQSSAEDFCVDPATRMLEISCRARCQPLQSY